MGTNNFLNVNVRELIVNRSVNHLLLWGIGEHELGTNWERMRVVSEKFRRVFLRLGTVSEKIQGVFPSSGVVFDKCRREFPELGVVFDERGSELSVLRVVIDRRG